MTTQDEVRGYKNAAHIALRALNEALAAAGDDGSVQAVPLGSIRDSVRSALKRGRAFGVAPGTVPVQSLAMTTRDVMVNFRATEAERDALDRAAARCGMTRTDWLREVALAAAGESDLLRDLDRARKRAAKMEGR